jgi:hypothetical protein
MGCSALYAFSIQMSKWTLFLNKSLSSQKEKHFSVKNGNLLLFVLLRSGEKSTQTQYDDTSSSSHRFSLHKE